MPTFTAAGAEASHTPTDLDCLVVLASTFRHEPNGRRARHALDFEAIEDRFAEHVVLETCHRVELIGVVRDGLPAVPAGVALLRGAEAVERVLLVTAGFDSAVVAEEQLLGQVRNAYELALARGTSGPLLNELLRRAIRLGRRVRSEATPGSDRSLADRAVSWGLDRLRADGDATGSALVIGSGEMGRILSRRLAAAGLRVTVASRSLDRARRIAEALPNGGQASLLTDVMASPGRHRLVAVALRSSEGMLRPGTLDDTTNVIVVDLSSPSAVSPALGQLLGDRLLDIDRLGEVAAQPTLAPSAERRLRADLAAERDRYVAWLAARGAEDAIVLLRREAEAARRRHLDRLRRRAALSDEQLAAVDAMTGALVAELLHGPTARLREGGEMGQLVLDLYGPGW